MCHQSVGLIQGALEDVGIATVSVSVCPEITEKVAPPRALYVPYAFGYPLGRPKDPGLQRRIILKALSLFDAKGPPPVMEGFEETA